MPEADGPDPRDERTDDCHGWGDLDVVDLVVHLFRCGWVDAVVCGARRREADVGRGVGDGIGRDADDGDPPGLDGEAVVGPL